MPCVRRRRARDKALLKSDALAKGGKERDLKLKALAQAKEKGDKEALLAAAHGVGASHGLAETEKIRAAWCTRGEGAADEGSELCTAWRARQAEPLKTEL